MQDDVSGSKAATEDLVYLIEFLDRNVHDIAEDTLFDVAAVAGDIATLGRILREGGEVPTQPVAECWTCDEHGDDVTTPCTTEPRTGKVCKNPGHYRHKRLDNDSAIRHDSIGHDVRPGREVKP